jgi:hypothetical protein
MKDQTTTDIREAEKTLDWNFRRAQDAARLEDWRVEFRAPEKRISQW